MKLIKIIFPMLFILIISSSRTCFAWQTYNSSIEIDNLNNATLLVTVKNINRVGWGLSSAVQPIDSFCKKIADNNFSEIGLQPHSHISGFEISSSSIIEKNANCHYKYTFKLPSPATIKLGFKTSKWDFEESNNPPTFLTSKYFKLPTVKASRLILEYDIKEKQGIYQMTLRSHQDQEFSKIDIFGVNIEWSCNVPKLVSASPSSNISKIDLFTVSEFLHNGENKIHTIEFQTMLGPAEYYLRKFAKVFHQ